MFFQHIFGRRKKDSISWTILISGYGRNMLGQKALDSFENMLNYCQPTNALFVALFSACSHAGEIIKAFDIYKLMESQYSIINPCLEFLCLNLTLYINHSYSGACYVPC